MTEVTCPGNRTGLIMASGGGSVSYTKADLEVVFRLGIITWQKRTPGVGAKMSPEEYMEAFREAAARVKKVKKIREINEDSNARIEELLRDGKDLASHGFAVDLLNPDAFKAGK